MGETMVDDASPAQVLRKQIFDECQYNWKLGWRTHLLYLFIIALTVGSSAVSSILALGFPEVDHRLIGSIALIPGICAGVSDRFHLRLKKHWYYRKYDKLNALVRRMDFVLLPEAGLDEIAKVAKDFCRVDTDMSRAWERLEEERDPAKPEGDG